MTSLKDRPHGEYVDLERVIVKHLSAENAELLRTEKGLAKLLLGDAAFVTAIEKLWVNGLYRSADWQIDMWRSMLDRDECPEIVVDFESLRASCPERPEQQGDLVLLVPNFVGPAKDGSGELLIGALLKTLEGYHEVDTSDLRSEYRSRIQDWMVAPSWGFRFPGLTLEWRRYRVCSFKEKGCGLGAVATASMAELLLAVIVHRRWARSLRSELGCRIIVYTGRAGRFWNLFGVDRGHGRQMIHLQKTMESNLSADAASGHRPFLFPY